MAEPTPETTARALLTWASVIAVVAITVLIIDFAIKRQILEASRGGHPAKGQSADIPADPAVDAVDHDPVAQAPQDPARDR